MKPPGYSVLSRAMNNSVKTFDGLDRQYTSEEHLQQNDANIITTIGEQTLDPVACVQWHTSRMA